MEVLLDLLLPVLEGLGVATAASLVIYAITLLIRLVAGRKPSEVVLKILVFIAASVVTYFVEPVAFPEFTGDPAAFAVALSAQATLFFKAAQVWYDEIWRKLMARLSPSLA